MLLLAGSAFAQEDTVTHNDHGPSYWAGLSIGKTHFGPTLEADVSFAWESNVLSVRYVKADELRWNPGGGGYDEPALRLRMVGLLYGRSYRKKSLVLSLAAGPGYIDAMDRGSYVYGHQFEEKSLKGFAIPFEGDARIELGGHLGIVVSCIGVISRGGSYLGGSVGIALGRF